MKLSQRQGEGNDRKVSAAGGRTRQTAGQGIEAAAPARPDFEQLERAAPEDDPYRGKSDGEILQRYEF